MIQLLLYNFIEPGGAVAGAQKALPEGSHLILKEPYLKCYNSGALGLRCDNPCNVVIVPSEAKPGGSSPGAVHDAEAAKAKGNTCYRGHDYPGAVRAYSQGLSMAGPDISMRLTLLSNRAAAFLATHDFVNALKDCDEALKIDPGKGPTRLDRGIYFITWWPLVERIPSPFGPTVDKWLP